MGHWLSAVWFPCATQIFVETTAHPGVVFEISIACENPTRELFAEELGYVRTACKCFHRRHVVAAAGRDGRDFRRASDMARGGGASPTRCLTLRCPHCNFVCKTWERVRRCHLCDADQQLEEQAMAVYGRPTQGGLGARGAWAGNAPCLILPYQTCRCSLLGVLGVMLAPALPAALQQANSISRWPTGRRFRSTLVRRRRFLC